MIELNLQKNGTDFRTLVVEDRPYTDSIFKVEVIELRDGDSFTINYDLWITSYTDGEETARIRQRFEYTAECHGPRMFVRFIRFTKLYDTAQIRVYSVMPSDIALPNPARAATRTG
jgi:hypothetical protein